MAFKRSREKSDSFTNVFVDDKTGEIRERETLAGKSRRFCQDLKMGYGYTIDPDTRQTKHVKLNKRQRAWRAGYLAANKDRAKEFRRRNPKYVRKT